VLGYENLLVCDGSAIRANVSVNPGVIITVDATDQRHRAIA